MISISVDVTQLDKTRFKTITRKNGKKAVFCDLILIDCNSDYGDYLVKQSVTKEERAAKKEMPILGNGKILEANRRPASTAAKQPPPAAADKPEDDPGDVPF